MPIYNSNQWLATKQPNFTHRVATLAILVLTIGLLGASPPPTAHAGKAKPSVTASASKASVAVGTRFSVSGRVSRGSKGMKVKLQQKSGSRWNTIGTKARGSKAKYSFSVVAADGSRSYRVTTTKTKKHASGRSRTVVVRGVKPTPAPVVPAATLSARDQILADTNKYRAQDGKRALKAHSGLNALSQTWAQTMSTTQRMFHNPRFAALTPGNWRRVAENVAMGYDPTAVTKAWFNSPGHRANMLGDYTHIGIGVVIDRWGTEWLVQNFAKY